MNNLSERLVHIMEIKGLTQVELAKLCDISQQSVNYILRNGLKRSKLAPLIAERLEINPNWLIYGQGRLYQTPSHEVVLINGAGDLAAYIDGKLDQSSANFIVTERYLGEKAFAYQINRKDVIICCFSKEHLPNEANRKYLIFNNENWEIKLVDTEVDSAFPVAEIRTYFDV